jgi:hypothetical protein
MSEGIHSIPISKRSPTSWAQFFFGILSFILLSFGSLMINASQLIILLPLQFLPFQFAIELHNLGVRLSKGAGGTLLGQLFLVTLFPISTHFSSLVFISQWFAPSTLLITLQHDGPGAFSQHEIDKIAIRGSDGRVLALNLPRKSVLIANHQVST